MAFRASHLSLALSLVALALAGVAIYRNTYEAMNMGLQKLSPNFELSESAVSILTLNNNVDQQNSHELSQQSPESCVFSAVRGVVDSAIDTERRMGASLIRLHFHDCFVDGCDGGILLDDIAGSFQGEQTSPPNDNSARGYEVIAQAKQSVKDTCPNISVSCADILAIAARDSVVKLGGQTYNIALGRRDARTANFTGALTQLPAPFDNLTVQITKFSDKNFTVREMVALAGAHTVGFTRCVTVCNSNNVNPAASLSCNCSVTQNNTNLQQLDTTPTVFDKVYYEDLIDSMLQPRLPEWAAGDPLEDRVINAMWLYLMTYRLADEEKIDETSVWYVMDELGSALRHSDKPNFRVSPFLYMPEGNLASALSYSILWPIDDVREGDECTRDYLFGIGEEKQRSARLTAWFHTPKNYFLKEYEKYKNKLQSNKFVSPVQGSSVTNSLRLGDGSALRVYTDIPPVEEYLTRPEFVITTEPKDADIIWTSMQIDEERKKAAGLNDEQYINQFPFEACLVMKHHLAETIQKAHGLVEWLQPTYNLETQLTQLIGDFHQREREKLDNLWILKPWNMARTIDTTITSNLSAIIRLMETGPKIGQKYIEHPALFKGRKFDLRYIVLVRSMNPLEIFLAEVFWVRLANNTYTLEKHSFDEYETHFTVMNYRGRLNHMNTPDFVKEFEKEHEVNWLDIHSRIRSMIKSAFEAAAVVHPEMHHSKSRAMYGVDVMLDCHFQPKLLEITYCPDCGRAVKYDTEALGGGGETVKGKDFYNYIFGCLFLNETNHVSQL